MDLALRKGRGSQDSPFYRPSVFTQGPRAREWNRVFPMYLVELRPGKEELYRTGDELAAAIRNGDVDTHSRIYHRATSKWISVTLHPQYKAIISEVRPSGPQLPPLDRQTWTFFNDPTDELAGAHDPEPPAATTRAATTIPISRGAGRWRSA